MTRVQSSAEQHELNKDMGTIGAATKILELMTEACPLIYQNDNAHINSFLRVNSVQVVYIASLLDQVVNGHAGLPLVADDRAHRPLPHRHPAAQSQSGH